LGAITTDFQPGNHDMELAIALDLSLQSVEEVTFEFSDFAASQTGHMDMISLWSAFVVMFFTLHVHEIEFIHQAMAFEQGQRAVNRDSVNLRIQPAGAAQELAGVEVLLGRFHNAEDGAALASHAQAARH